MSNQYEGLRYDEDGKLLIETPAELVEALRHYGSVKKVGRAIEPDLKNFPMKGYSYARRLYALAVADNLLVPHKVGRKNRDQLVEPVKLPGKVGAPEKEVRELPEKGEVKTYLLTCAQNATAVHTGFWNNLTTLADYYDAEIMVSRFVYITNGLASLYDKKQMIEKLEQGTEERMWWDERLTPYLNDEQVELAPGLVWCGEMNTLPTAVNPLSGLEVYTGRASGIFPHTKVAMRTVPSSKYEPTKFNYTTGAATLRNYIQRKAGLKAEFHHTYGALIVEVDSDGDWFVRQVIADEEGTIYDLNVRVKNGALTASHRVEAITWGDIHVASLDPVANIVAFGKGGVLDTLQPKYQFLHDVLDFRQAASHHERHRPHVKFKRWLDGNTDVRGEIADCAVWMKDCAERTWCKTVVVHSNHHDHLGRWLEEVDGRHDPKNFEFWSQMQLEVIKEYKFGTDNPNYFELAMLAVGYNGSAEFLGRDESMLVLDIECGQHGHAGPNGSRGTPNGFAKMGHRMNIADKHTGEIWDGLFVAGTLSSLTPDWTEGASSWSHTNTVIYPHGKRAQITFWNGKAWADRGANDE